MKLQRKFDYIIAGGGLSGLVLALKMQELMGSIQVLLIDWDAKDKNDRTWSYWAKPEDRLPAIACQSWSNIKVYDQEGNEHRFSIDPYRYYTVRGKDFYQYAQDKLRPDPRFTFLQAEITGLEEEPAAVHTAGRGTFQASLVFKSYFSPQDLPVSGPYHFLYQQFKGWVVETKKPCFEEQALTLMDFRAPTPDTAARFHYVLPFSTTRALVEYTAFTPELLAESIFEENLSWYLQTILGIEDYQIRHTEFASIPMTDYPFCPPGKGRIIPIGTIAGYVKGSTGYCYTRTFEKIDQLVRHLCQKKEIPEVPLSSSRWYRLLDSILLDILYRRKVPADRLFTQLYSKTRPSVLFRFLDEKASWPEILQVMRACPSKGQFLVALFRKIPRLLNGKANAV